MAITGATEMADSLIFSAKLTIKRGSLHQRRQSQKALQSVDKRETSPWNMCRGITNAGASVPEFS
jgi:hypothetical protein